MKLHNTSILHETITVLKKIKVKECKEKMVDLEGECKKIFFSEKCFKRKHGTFVRKTVRNKLLKALNFIPKKNGFFISSAFRSIKEQEKSYKKVFNKLEKRHPEWSKNILVRETNKYCFPVGKGVIPYHSTGGAIDVYLCNLNGKILKKWDKDRFLESRIEHFPLSKKALENRKILKNAMEKVGFTNYPLEFWHWSYGDTGWALRTNTKTAIYGLALPEFFE